ncbi:MAG: porin family protein [Myxococcota bacterium]
MKTLDHRTLLGALCTALVFTVATTTTALAKDDSAALSGFGLKLGGTLATATSDNSAVTDAQGTKLGFGGGIQVVLGLTNWFAVQPEVLYQNKGTQAEQTLPEGAATVTTNLNYIQVPVLASIRIPALRAITPKLFVGPHMAFLLSASERQAFEDSTVTQAVDNSNFSTFDFGFTGGLGVDFKMGGSTLTTELRLERGLLNYLDGDNTTLRHQSASVFVGVVF